MPRKGARCRMTSSLLRGEDSASPHRRAACILSRVVERTLPSSALLCNPCRAPQQLADMSHYIYIYVCVCVCVHAGLMYYVLMHVWMNISVCICGFQDVHFSKYRVPTSVCASFLIYVIWKFPVVSPIIAAFFFGSTAPIWALAYLHETLRFTSVYYILDIR
jgi:hypothetical protein